jgi:hypothetical protein
MRLVTRADLDGLLQEVERIDRVDFAHPKDVQDGKLDLGGDDILANLPYDERAGLWFDHHLSQVDQGTRAGVAGKFALAPSAARVIFDHYKSPKFDRFAELLDATDRLDSAQLTRDDIVDPKGWILIGYTLDPRTGLGAFKDYFRHLMELAKTKDAEQILADPEVAKHVDRLRAENEAFKEHLRSATKQDGNVVITNVRGMKDLPSGNRFLIYELFPTANVSVRVADGHDGSFVSIQVGHSVLKRDCRTNVGDLMAQYGGGGHLGAGTCQPQRPEARRVLGEIVAALKANG